MQTSRATFQLTPILIYRLLALVLIAWSIVPVSATVAVAQDHQFGAEQVQTGYRFYSAQCQLCHGANGDGIPTVNLARQRFPHAVSDDDIRNVIKTGNAAGMPAFILKPEELEGLVAYIRSGMDQSGVRFRLGDVTRGKAVFSEAGCGSCHRVAGVGPYTAPDLSDIGFIRRPAQLMTSLLDPNSAMMPINKTLVIVTRSGETLRGRRLNEDTYSVQFFDEHGELRSMAKSDMLKYEVREKSEMPSYRGRLNEDKIADLLAYLVSLKG